MIWAVQNASQSILAPYVKQKLTLLLEYLFKDFGRDKTFCTALIQNTNAIRTLQIPVISKALDQFELPGTVTFFNAMMQVLFHQRELREVEKGYLLDCWNFCKISSVQQPVGAAFYHLFINKSPHQAFQCLHNVTQGAYHVEQSEAKILLAHCYLNSIGCDRDVAKALRLLKEAFLNNPITSQWIISMFEKITEIDTPEYHLTLGNMYRGVGRYPEAKMQLTIAGDCAAEPYREMLLEIAKKKEGEVEDTLPEFQRAAYAGSADACIHIGDLYRDGKIEHRTNFLKAVENYYRAGSLPNGFNKAESSLIYIVHSPAASDANKQLASLKLAELDFKRCVLDKQVNTILIYAKDSPLLACVIRECCIADGAEIKNANIAQYYFTKDLKVKCQTEILGREQVDSVYAHFLFARELMADGVLFSGYTSYKAQGMLHMCAALMIAELIDPQQDNIVLKDLHMRLTTWLGQLQQNKKPELAECAKYLSMVLYSRETLPTSLQMPALLTSQLPNPVMNSNNDTPIILPPCLLHQLGISQSHEGKATSTDTTPVPLSRLPEYNVQPSAPPASAHERSEEDAMIQEARSVAAWCAFMHSKPETRRLLQHLSPGTRLGGRSSDEKEINKRHSY